MIPFEGVLFAASVVGTLAVVLTFVVRGREIGWEMSGESVFALYVRIASLAGSVVFAIGLAELLRAWLITAPLPEGYTALTSRLPGERVVRGATLLAAGGGFWVLHYLLPRPAVRGGGALYMAFLTVGAATFGLAALLTLPLGIAEELQRLFGFTAPPRTDGTLGGGLAALAVWLGHLSQLRSHLGHGGMQTFSHRMRINPAGPLPPEPAVVGAPLVRPPDTRSAGATAVPPEER